VDPLTIGLVIAAVAAGLGIKRAAAPPAPPRSPEVAVAPEAPSFGIPAPAFGGGLRPPVTHKEIAKDRTLEADRGGGGSREEEDEQRVKVTLTPGQQAQASGAAPDVAGSSGGHTERAPTPQQWAYVPAQGKWGGGYVLYDVSPTGGLVGAPTSAVPR
jgi:hypothetical protein